MFKVAPNGSTKLETLCEIPRFSQQAIVNGNVADELAVPNATIIASAIAAYNINTGTFENIFKNIGYTTNNCIANPIATILSAAMMLRYTFDLDQEADAIERAVQQVLKEGYRTIDIMPQAGESTEGITKVGTAQMGDLIAERV